MITRTTTGFLFDMDGTLVDSTAVVEEVWAEACERLDISFERVLATSHGRQARATLADHAPDLQGPELEEVLDWMAYAEETRLDGVVEVPGAAALMTTLLNAGAPVALVTSAHLALAEARMTAAGVPMPAVRVTAESVTRSKPDPEGYALGARLLSLRPDECLGFEDADAGIAAVEAAGAQLVVVGTLSSSQAGVRVPDLRAVAATVDRGRWTLHF